MRARRRFAQHFLEPAWVAKLVKALAPHPDDVFLEIGPGRGALTRALAPMVSRVIAVEIDRDLVSALRADMPDHVEVVEGDVLAIDFAALCGPLREPVRVVGNLPYNISSPILFALLAACDGGRRLRDATLMLQREVADRLVAVPGGADYGVLALQVAQHADATRLLTLPPGAFRPAPAVASAVVQLRFHPPAVDGGDPARFEALLRAIFTQRRKTLLNALRAALGCDAPTARGLLESVPVDPNRRPQTLTLAEMARLARVVFANRPPNGY